ncbi:MAG: LysR substrate-binding domain-containing protein [Moraxellaceae bacterium]|nr:LysR substrate-binding domain-containing protein [Moraxellaceae bacterium]
MDERNSPVRPPRRLPPLAALRAFEAAAANLSFQRAAQELFVSPTAISHQIRALEKLLETPLFHRLARRVELTPEGLRLFHMVKDGLDTIELGLAAMRRGRAASSLVLTTNTAFAAHWLLPRMGSLREAVPQVDIRLNATETVVDLARGEADIAIRSGDGDWPALTAQRLAFEHYAPMCSPLLGVTRPADLQRHKLIHFEWQPRAKSPALWSRWFQAAKLKPPKGKESLAFSDETHAILAVMAGHGVGLLSPTLMAGELASGRLVQPFGPQLATGGYYLACLPARRDEPRIAAVWEWFTQQFALQVT